MEMSPSYYFDPSVGEAVAGNPLASELQHEEQSVDLNIANEQRLEASEGRRNQRLGHTGAFDPLEEGDRKLLNLTNLMSKAQAEGDQVAIKRLESIMDQLAAGEVSFKKATAQAPKKAPEAPQEAPQQPKEDAEGDTTQTENERLVEAYKGSESYNRLKEDPSYAETIQWMNENASEQDIKALMTLPPDEAHIIYSMNKSRAQATSRAEVAGFDNTQAQGLSETYGAKADVIVDLSNKVASGELTQAAAMTAAMKDPQLLAVASQMLQDGAISWS